MATRLVSLEHIRAACWSEMALATQQRGHPWRTMALATRSGDGADARMVVLREVDETLQTLFFFTDTRSTKMAQLGEHPQGQLVLWSAERGWQLRLRVQLSAQLEGPAVAARWERIRHSPAAQDYLSTLAPGRPLDEAPPPASRRRHFAVVSAQVQAMDWLELHESGHRRALFDGEGARWVQA